MPIKESHSTHGSVRLSSVALWGRRAPCAARGFHRNDLPPLVRLRGPASVLRRLSGENPFVCGFVDHSKVSLKPPRPPETNHFRASTGRDQRHDKRSKRLFRREEEFVALIVGQLVQLGGPDTVKIFANVHEVADDFVDSEVGREVRLRPLPSEECTFICEVQRSQHTDGREVIARYQAVDRCQGYLRRRGRSSRLRSAGIERFTARESNLPSLLGLRLPVVAQSYDGLQPSEPKPPEALLHGAKPSG